jgi:DNA invertase Pin-like site-specific DNA recombinase
MEPQANGALIRVAEYVRMSTDDQKYSPENQSETNGEYAAAHDMLIVRTYLDGGRSGLNFDRRDGLRQLIEDVLTGKADFRAILVLDVSRWGRFQDPDESGYYEYTCKRAGIMVHYTAEQFENDGTPIAAVIKVLKRAMAGEYSRELSVKVFNGQRRLINLGYRQGASAGYGLRRLLVDQNGVAKGTLKRGELKSIQSDRVLLIPGPPDELDIVRLIFRLFVAQKKNAGAIASLLNQREIRNVKGGRWRRHHVRHVLKNENYIGNVVWNRQSAKLKGKIVNNGPDKWVRVTGVLEATVAQSQFESAQSIISARRRQLSNDEMLEPLRRLLRKHGALSARLISKSARTPSPSFYERHFGGLIPAYEMIGFTARSRCCDGRLRRSLHAVTRRLSNDQALVALKELYETHGYLTRQMINETAGVPSAGTYSRRFGGLEHAYELIGLPWTFPNHPPRRPHRSSLSLSRHKLLKALQGLLHSRGRLTRKIIDEAEGVPSAATYQRRFGGVTPAYKLIGYAPELRATQGLAERTKSMSDKQLLSAIRRLLRQRGHLSRQVIDESKSVPATSTYLRRFGSLSRVYKLIDYKPVTPVCRP